MSLLFFADASRALYRVLVARVRCLVLNEKLSSCRKYFSCRITQVNKAIRKNILTLLVHCGYEYMQNDNMNLFLFPPLALLP